MAASTSVPLTPKQQAAFVAYYGSVQDLRSNNRNEFRAYLERMDRNYQREMDKSQEHQRAQQANRSGDTSRLQNVTVPVVMPQVEAAVVHQTSVFLTGHPIFGVVSDPEYIDEALQIESVIEDQSIRGGWVRELMMHFRDGMKYNFAPLEVSWEQEVTHTVTTDPTKSVTQGIPKEVIWSGNKVKRLDPYNTFVDTRVAPTDLYKDGEFAGYTQFMTRIKLKSYVAALPDKIIGSIKPAFESGGGTAGGTGSQTAGAKNYFIPDINPLVSESDNKSGGMNWERWAGLNQAAKKIDYKDTYEVTTLYCRVLPSEFDLKVPNSNTPQIYKLVIVNHEHIIYCEQQTNAHGYLPILIGQPLEDGLGYQTKSLADNAIPFQEVTSSYMSSILASRRRAISDRVLYDPSRITSAHINSSNPSAKIPVRPAAYGKNLGESVHQFPYREDQAGSSMQQISALLGMANTLNGQNQVQQGQFQKGNKTLSEFESVMANANGRDQLASILLESQVFTPMKLILKLNILQFQGGTTVYNRDAKQAVEIDPVQLRKAVVEFQVSDGLTPASKLLNSETFATALQVIGSSPQISGGYNIAQMFSYMMKTQGADISPFEKSAEQSAYEQAFGQWQQLVAMGLEKGIDLAKTSPAPTPEQFGYVPAQNKPSPEGAKNPSSAPVPTSNTGL